MGPSPPAQRPAPYRLAYQLEELRVALREEHRRALLQWRRVQHILRMIQALTRCAERAVPKLEDQEGLGVENMPPLVLDEEEEPLGWLELDEGEPRRVNPRPVGGGHGRWAGEETFEDTW